MLMLNENEIVEIVIKTVKNILGGTVNPNIEHNIRSQTLEAIDKAKKERVYYKKQSK